MTITKLSPKRIIDSVILLGASIDFKTIGQEVTSISSFEITDFLLRKLDTHKMANAICDKDLTVLFHKTDEATTFTYLGNNRWLVQNPQFKDNELRSDELQNLLEALVGMHSTKQLSSNYEIVQTALNTAVVGEEMFYAFDRKQFRVFNINHDKQFTINFKDTSVTYYHFSAENLEAVLKL